MDLNRNLKMQVSSRFQIYVVFQLHPRRRKLSSVSGEGLCNFLGHEFPFVAFKVACTWFSPPDFFESQFIVMRMNDSF